MSDLGHTVGKVVLSYCPLPIPYDEPSFSVATFRVLHPWNCNVVILS